MNPDLHKLHPYPFEKLAALKAGITPEVEGHIALSIGEPKHAAPEIVLQTLRDKQGAYSQYPLTRGMDALREAIADWLIQRFQLPENTLDASRHILPVNGTREALFAFAQCCVNREKKLAGKPPLVLMPNPFYQIYEGATLLAGGEPYYYPTGSDTGYQPDFDAIDETVWQRCQLIYICSPGNPTGSVIDETTLVKLIQLARQFDFIIAADECYSEIYFDETRPPTGLLQAASHCGLSDYKNCMVFHSLSKRSNLPGLRSGFVAGDAALIQSFLLYRTYHGCAMPPPTQYASISAWQDETHVQQNRHYYREKFAAVIKILRPVIDVNYPDAGFYLWLKTPYDDTRFAQQLYQSQNISVLPGSFLSREVDNNTGKPVNPGARHVRLALVAPLDECVMAAQRIKLFLQ